MEGWIKLHRKTLDNPIICKDNDTLAIWIYLLLNATHQEIPALFKGKKITLKKGQLITGRNSIGRQLNISSSKVQRVLKIFEDDGQIEQQTNNQNRLISIVNWDKYQENEQQMNNERTTTEQQMNTNKNVKNDKNERMKENKNIKKEQEEKIHFAEFVTMTNVEYNKLVNTYSKEFADQCITVLDNYKGSNGKKYKSDYRAILNWVVDRVNQDKLKKQNNKGRIDDFRELWEEAQNE